MSKENEGTKNDTKSDADIEMATDTGTDTERARVSVTDPIEAPCATVEVSMLVNGRLRELYIPARERLLDTLRQRLGLISVKEGCGTGECGACIVLLDGAPINSCITFTAQLEGAEITTLEGLTPGDGPMQESAKEAPSRHLHLHPLQEAFIDAGAVQCGFCTPGMILTAKALLDRYPSRVPDESTIRAALAGNLCRCTGYRKIVDAVQLAAERILDLAQDAASETERETEMETETETETEVDE